MPSAHHEVLFNAGPRPLGKRTMKRWIKRTVIAVFSATALFGGLAAWAQHRGMGWGTMSPQDATEMKARMVEKVARRLDLDAAQKTRLGTLADALNAQRLAMAGNSADPRAEWQGLIAGNTFDRAKATSLVQAKVAAVTTGSPAVITALGDFYDSLRPEQQAKVREFTNRRGHGMKHGMHHGAGDGQGPRSER